MEKTVYDFKAAAKYLEEYPLDDLTEWLKTSAINLANAGLSSAREERMEIVLHAQSAIFNVTEFLDSIIAREVEQ